MGAKRQQRICAASDCVRPTAASKYCPEHTAQEQLADALRLQIGGTRTSADVRVRLGAAYVQLGRHEDALAQYEEAVRLAPENVEAHVGLGVTAVLTGDRLGAMEACLALDELDSERAAALASFMQSYTPPGITFEGGSGDTIETAVIIRGASTHSVGVDAEYRYLEQQFGTRTVDWEPGLQSLIKTDDRKYDKIDIRLSDGSHQTVYFDITEFFGA